MAALMERMRRVTKVGLLKESVWENNDRFSYSLSYIFSFYFGNFETHFNVNFLANPL